MALLLLIAAGVALLLVLSFRFPVGRDSGHFLTIAACLVEGGRYYEHVWNLKPPGLPATLSVLFSLLGPSLAAARTLMLLLNAFAAWFIWRIGVRLGWSTEWRLAAVAVYVWLVPLYIGQTVMTEVPVMALCVFALLLLVERDDKLTRLPVFVAGFLIGAATLYKQVGILYLPAVLALLAGHWRVRGRTATIAVFLAGVAIPPAALSAYFALTGRLQAFLDAVLMTVVSEYPAELAGLTVTEALIELAKGQVARGFVIWIPATLAGATAIWRFVRRGESSTLALLALATAFSFMPSYKRTYEHYVIAYLPMLCILGVEGWRMILRHAGGATSRRVLLAAIALTMLIPAGRIYGKFVVPQVIQNGLGRQMDVARRIESHLQPDEPIITAGNESQYYFLTRRYRHFPPTFIDPWSSALWSPADLAAALDTTQGLRYVVLASGDTSAVAEAFARIRRDGERIFDERIPGRERVELYRLAR